MSGLRVAWHTRSALTLLVFSSSIGSVEALVVVCGTEDYI